MEEQLTVPTMAENVSRLASKPKFYLGRLRRKF
jgi:hypothetical protein